MKLVFSMLVAGALLAVLFVTPVQARSDRIESMSYAQLYKASKKAIAHGHIWSIRHGGASPYLTRICYEMLERKFAPHGTAAWAAFVVRRESGCNPGAVNTTYSDPMQQATGLSQMIPAVHTWVNYKKVKHDLNYAIAVFMRLSRNGHYTQPWRCC